MFYVHRRQIFSWEQRLELVNEIAGCVLNKVDIFDKNFERLRWDSVTLLPPPLIHGIKFFMWSIAQIISNTDSTSLSIFFVMPYGYDSAKVKRSGLKYFCDNILVSLEIAIILLIPYEVANFSKHLLHPAFLASFYFLTLLVLLLEAIFLKLWTSSPTITNTIFKHDFISAYPLNTTYRTCYDKGIENEFVWGVATKHDNCCNR